MDIIQTPIAEDVDAGMAQEEEGVGGGEGSEIGSGQDLFLSGEHAQASPMGGVRGTGAGAGTASEEEESEGEAVRRAQVLCVCVCVCVCFCVCV